MKEFFASIYEWFGLFPLYSRDLGDHLRGWDITCSDYIGTPWYSYIGWLMFIITLFIYALQYHMIDHPRYNKKIHWWLSALTIVLLNFFTAVLIPYNSIQSGEYCSQLNFSVSDCIGFGFSNSLVSFIFFIFLTSFKYPKYFAINCSRTTFWNP